jgi:uncharacterized protein YydD (DUF2326 family)
MERFKKGFIEDQQAYGSNIKRVVKNFFWSYSSDESVVCHQETTQQDLSSTNKDAENHHLRWALGHEEFVGKVQSEIEHLNKIIESQELNKQYNKIMTSQKLKKMQDLSNFYSNMSNTLEKLIKSVPI